MAGKCGRGKIFMLRFHAIKMQLKSDWSIANCTRKFHHDGNAI